MVFSSLHIASIKESKRALLTRSNWVLTHAGCKDPKVLFQYFHLFESRNSPLDSYWNQIPPSPSSKKEAIFRQGGGGRKKSPPSSFTFGYQSTAWTSLCVLFFQKRKGGGLKSGKQKRSRRREIKRGCLYFLKEAPARSLPESPVLCRNNKEPQKPEYNSCVRIAGHLSAGAPRNPNWVWMTTVSCWGCKSSWWPKCSQKNNNNKPPNIHLLDLHFCFYIWCHIYCNIAVWESTTRPNITDIWSTGLRLTCLCALNSKMWTQMSHDCMMMETVTATDFEQVEALTWL